jgi:thymidine kinase
VEELKKTQEIRVRESFEKKRVHALFLGLMDDMKKYHQFRIDVLAGKYDFIFKFARLVECETKSPVRSSLKIITGPMFAGKTTILFRHLESNAKGGRKVILVKFAADTRYSNDEACSHNGERHVSLPAFNLKSIEWALNQYEVIGIDEASFFPDLYPVVLRLLHAGKRIFLSLLDAAYTGELWPPGGTTSRSKKPYPPWYFLIPFCNVYTRITSTCGFCGIESAEMTLKVDTEGTKIEEIGGGEKYMSACFVCWKKHTNGTGLLIKPKKETTKSL